MWALSSSGVGDGSSKVINEPGKARIQCLPSQRLQTLLWSTLHPKWRIFHLILYWIREHRGTSISQLWLFTKLFVTASKHSLGECQWFYFVILFYLVLHKNMRKLGQLTKIMRTVFARKKRSTTKEVANLASWCCSLCKTEPPDRVSLDLVGINDQFCAWKVTTPQTSAAVSFQSVLFKMHKGSWKVVSLIISKLPTHWVNQDCENKNCRISQHWLVDRVVKGSLLMSNFSSTGQQWVLNYYPEIPEWQQFVLFKASARRLSGVPKWKQNIKCL